MSKQDLKEDLEKVKSESHPLEYAFGPLNKSEETRKFEQIMSSVMSDRYQESAKQYDQVRSDPKQVNGKGKYIDQNTPTSDPNYEKKVTFSVENNQLWVELHDQNNEKVNMSELLKKVNFGHVSLPETDLKKYEDLYENNQKMNGEVLSKEDFKKRISETDLTQQEYLPKLSHAEMLAINSYSSSNYTEMNGLLRGTKIPNDPAKTLIENAIASQGLNKVPDIELPVVTRYQDEYGLDKMKDMANLGKVDEVPAFISTAFEGQKGFGTVQIIYENVRGKSISALSQYPHEQEYLIPPTTQIKFTGHKFENGKHTFTAEGSNVLLDQVYNKEAPIKARAEIDTKINEISEKFKNTREISNKELGQFMIDSAKIAHKHGLINDQILDKYVDTVTKSTQEVEKVGKFKKLGVKDKLVLAVSNVADKIGLKSLSTKLENKISPEGKKTIEMEKKMSQLFEKARNIGSQLNSQSSTEKTVKNPSVVNKTQQRSGGISI